MNTRRLCCLALFAAVGLAPVSAWDYAGHRLINQVALASLPADFPAFVREPAAAERIAFLAGEPDRWRNNEDLPIKHANGLDHYLDVEMLADAGLTPATVAPMRLAFATQFAAGRVANPGAYAPIDPAKNRDRTREWPGFAPWAIAEHYGKLRSAFAYLKAFEEHGGTAEEIANARANAVYIMGVMGHFVGDCAQPLHTTVHHNGWVGANPQGYVTKPGIHAWMDGGLIAKARIDFAALAAGVRPAAALELAEVPADQDALFNAVMAYVMRQHAHVETVYALEKSGELGLGPTEVSPAARALVEGQLLAGGRMLAAIWITAWQTAPVDTYLQAQLAKRQAEAPKE